MRWRPPSSSGSRRASCGRGRAVQRSDHVGRRENRPCPRRRLHDCLQAGTRNPAGCIRAGRSGRGRRRATRGGERPARETPPSARRSSPTRASIGWCSPAAPGRAGDLVRPAPGRFKRLTLELGGKAAAVLLDDAPDRAVDRLDPADELLQQRTGLHRARSHSGAPTRYDEVVDAAVEATRAMTVGDPRDPALSSARSSRHATGRGSKA